MWVTKFKIKKLFSKIYKNTKTVYESIYFDIGELITPLVLTGANGIGGGKFGSFIDINSKITNNTVLDITSNSKDEDFVTNYTFNINEGTLGVFTQETTLLECNYCIIDLYYFYVVGGVFSDTIPRGVYITMIVDGGTYYTSRNETTNLAGDYDAEGIMTRKSGHKLPGGGHTALWTNYCKEFIFNSPKTVKIIFNFDFSGYNSYMASPIEGRINVTSLKATNDITRDIYATVIEQVNPAI